MGILENRYKGTKRLFKEIIAESFLNLERERYTDS